MAVTITSDAVNLQKNRQRYIDCYNNKQSVFIGKDETRKKIFVLKSKPTGSATKNDIVYIPVNLGKKVTGVFAKYEVGGGIGVDFEDQKLQEAYTWILDEKDFMKKLGTAMRKKSYVGFSVMRVRDLDELIDGKKNIAIDIIPTQNYYPNVYGLSIGDDFRSINEHYIVSEVTSMENGTKQIYAYVDSYIRTNGQRTYKRERYRSFGNGNKQLYNADTNGFTYTDLIDTPIPERQIDYLPLFIMNNEAEDNEDENTANNVFGQSDYRDIFELLQEYNDRYTQTSIEFIKHFESALSIPKSQLDLETQRERIRRTMAKDKGSEDEEVYTMDNKGKIFGHGPGETPAHYIVKDLQTDKSITWIDKVAVTIAKQVSIPVEFLIEGKQTKATTATEIIYNRDDFHQKVTTRQNEIKSELRRMIGYICALVAGYKEVKELPSIKFVVPIPKDMQEQTNIYTALRTSGLVSKKTAIKDVLGYDNDQAESEIEEINAEEKITSEVMGFGKPTPPVVDASGNPQDQNQQNDQQGNDQNLPPNKKTSGSSNTPAKQ